MNIQDGSDVPQMVDMLMKQRQNLLNAQSRKGQKPTQTQSRGTRIFQFNLQRDAKRLRKGEFISRTTFIPPAYTPCVTSLAGLNKIMLDDLVLETHHRGTYIALRSVTPPEQFTAISTLAEDETGDIVYLALYYQEHECIDEFLKEGTVLIIKEPYLKVLSDGSCGIRVDHLSDVLHLAPYDVKTPLVWQPKIVDMQAIHWKEEGNECFKESKFYTAIKHYTQALLCSPLKGETQTIELNRALAYFKTDQLDATINNVESAFRTQGTTQKGLYRKAQALYKLEKYQDCYNTSNTLLAEHPGLSVAQVILNQVSARLEEQKSGAYIFKQLHVEAAKQRPPHLGHSTYVGAVEVKVAGSRGRGLFTTAAIKAGDLMLCEKAFAHAFTDTSNEAHNQNLQIMINLETNVITMGTQADLIGLIIQKIYKNPSLASSITDLHHGTYRPVVVNEVDGKPIVDSFLIERIVSLNIFGAPLSTKELRLGGSSTKDQIAKATREKHFHSTGIWVKASYINHSCYANTNRTFIGDMIIIRATQDLPANTELTHWYHLPQPTETISNRQKKFNNWGFECKCIICQDDKETQFPESLKRIQLRNKLLAILQKPSLIVDLSIVDTHLADLAKTYKRPSLRVPRVAMWDLLLLLAKHHWAQRKPLLAIDTCVRCLTSLGFAIEGGKKSPIVIKRWGLSQDLLVECWIIISLSYDTLGNKAFAKAAFEYARVTWKIWTGDDEDFEEVCGRNGGGGIEASLMAEAASGGRMR